MINEKPQSARPGTPFLFPYATMRTEGEEILGEYCGETCMWLVDTKDGKKPIIDAQPLLAELTTKTENNVESDDDMVGCLAELVTKTSAMLEGDDARHASIETVTKTLANTESDDDMLTSASLHEVTTKTRVDAETDDTSTRLSSMFL